MMAERLPTVSVVIPTYQRREGVRAVLDSVLADPDTFEVVVVVDGSTDGTAEELSRREEAEPRLRVVVTENQGQMMAQQVGAAASRGDVVLFLDDDVVVGPTTVSGHARCHTQVLRPRVVVGAMPVEEGARGPGQWPVALYAQQYRTMIDRWQADDSLILRHLWGGHLSVPRASWQALPPYPGDRPLRYHLDWELGLRLADLGLGAVYCPQLAGAHHQRRTVDEFLRDRAASAHDRIYVHELYHAQLGDLPVEHFTKDCGPLASWLIRRRSRFLNSAVEVVLGALLPVTAAVHAYTVQRPVAIALASMRGASQLLNAEASQHQAHASP
jgi:glycosyltransferase involved in cell wall biosynthesis